MKLARVAFLAVAVPASAGAYDIAVDVNADKEKLLAVLANAAVAEDVCGRTVNIKPWKLHDQVFERVAREGWLVDLEKRTKELRLVAAHGGGRFGGICSLISSALGIPPLPKDAN